MHKIKLDNYTFNYQVFFKNNKHIYLRIKKGILTITCHKRYSKGDIETFIRKHKSWILKHIFEKQLDLYNLEHMSIWGKTYKLMQNPQLKESLFMDGEIIYYKDFLNEKEVEDFYKRLILEEIKNLINKNRTFLSQYIDLRGITYKSQLMRSRLGSCINNRKIIKINSLLARMDRKYLKLVLYHELAHLKISNHSTAFHTLLETLYPNHQKENLTLRKCVRKYQY
jgi:predicted metal-dependent hydrolase